MIRHSRDRGRRSGFTLLELLVVISIFLLLLLIAVPAFSSMLYSSEESLAENSMRSGLTAARDAAARGRQGQDGAAVFLYDAVAQKTSIVPCVQVGVLVEPDPVNPALTVRRDVFAPVPGYEPTSLPRGWMIRGYAAANTIDDQWYGDPAITGNPYAVSSRRLQGNWLFPENDFYDWDDEADGTDRHTFIVRFEGGTGALKPGDLDPVLVLDAVPSDSFRTSAPFNTYRADTAADKAKLVRTIVNAPFSGVGSLSIADRRALLGDEAVDTILAKPVTQLALCNEKKLAAGLGAASGTAVRLNSITGCIYLDPAAANYEPQIDPNVSLDDLNLYMEGRLSDTNGDPIQSEARLFTVHRYLGNLIEVTGSINGQGVSQ